MATASSLAATLTGTLLAPSDEGYNAARRVHNGLIDRRPALIARCADTDDIAAAVRHARDAGLEISVRGGGHNVAGRAVAEGGLMIDLAGMRAVDVDPSASTARAQGGARWSDVNDAAGAHGLAVTGGAISTTGIAGYTLGGGLGWLMSTQGLACDNLIAVELVTADGEVLEVTDESHPDLMWGLRGGGGNFGVAASLTYRLRPAADGRRRPDRAPVRGRRGHAAVLPRCDGGLPRRADLVRRAGARAGWLGDEAGGDDRLPHRPRPRGRRPGAVPGIRLAAGHRGRPDALSGDEHADRRGVPGGRAQLLAVQLHVRPLRTP